VIGHVEQLDVQLDPLPHDRERLVDHQVEGEERGEGGAVPRPDVGAADVDERA
jgi:hypothetical protein